MDTTDNARKPISERDSFTVFVTAEAYFDVEADSEEQAKEKALDSAKNNWYAWDRTEVTII